MRDALVAALTLDIFNRHADKVVMANVAQLINNLSLAFPRPRRQIRAHPKTFTYSRCMRRITTANHSAASSMRRELKCPAAKQASCGLAGSASLHEKRLVLTVV